MFSRNTSRIVISSASLSAPLQGEADGRNIKVNYRKISNFRADKISTMCGDVRLHCPNEARLSDMIISVVHLHVSQLLQASDVGYGDGDDGDDDGVLHFNTTPATLTRNCSHISRSVEEGKQDISSVPWKSTRFSNE